MPPQIVYETTSSSNAIPVHTGGSSPVELINTIRMLVIGKGRNLSNKLQLQAELIADVKLEDNNYIVVDYRTDEYGIGETLELALQDLLESLVGYYLSLKKRKSHLAEHEKNNLILLNELLNSK